FVCLIMNSTPTATLGWKSPIECFAGVAPVRPLDFFIDVNGELKTITVPKTVDSLVEEFHRDLKSREVQLVHSQAQQHEALIARQAKKRGLKRLEVKRGDFVMIHNDGKDK